MCLWRRQESSGANLLISKFIAEQERLGQHIYSEPETLALKLNALDRSFYKISWLRMAYRQVVCKQSRCIYVLLQRHAINHHTEHRNDWGKHNQAVNSGLSRITNHFVIRLFGLDCFFQVLFLTLAHITPQG